MSPNRQAGPTRARRPGARSSATWFPLHGGDGVPASLAPAAPAGLGVGRRASPSPPTANTWVLPPSVRSFLPAGCEHATRAAPDARLCGIYFTPAPVPAPLDATPTVVDGRRPARRAARRTSPTRDRRPRGAPARRGRGLRSARARAHDDPAPAGADRRARRSRRRPRRSAPTAPTAGRSPRGARVVGASDRTLARRFLDETGMTFSQWRTELRLATALPLLANGTSVAATASRRRLRRRRARFIAAFRRATGFVARGLLRAAAGGRATRRRRRSAPGCACSATAGSRGSSRTRTRCPASGSAKPSAPPVPKCPKLRGFGPNGRRAVVGLNPSPNVTSSPSVGQKPSDCGRVASASSSGESTRPGSSSAA